MITDQDNLFGHQTSAPMHLPAGSDTALSVYTERFWYEGHTVPEGDVVFNVGMGRYPGRGILDGYAGIAIDGRQYDVQVSRHAGDQPLSPTVGALQIEVLEGFGRHRLRVSPNESGLSLDLVFHGTMAPNEEGPELIRSGETVYSDVNRFVQLGKYSGWIDIDGRRIEFDPSTTWGARDRSWGRRYELRSDEEGGRSIPLPPMFYAFACLQFDTEAIHFFLKEKAPGKVRFLGGSRTGPLGAAGSAAVALAKVEHELVWDRNAPSQSLVGGQMRLSFEDGSLQTLELRSLPGRYYLKGGLYGGLNGWHHGDDKGPSHIGQSRWNLQDAGDRKVLRSLADQIVEVRDGDRVGFGTIQCGLSKGYGKYAEVEHLPPM